MVSLSLKNFGYISEPGIRRFLQSCCQRYFPPPPPSSSPRVPHLPAKLCDLPLPSLLLPSSWTHPHCSFLEDWKTGCSSIIITILASPKTQTSFKAHPRSCLPMSASPLLPIGCESQSRLHLLGYLPYPASCLNVCTCIIVALDVNCF